MLPARVVGDEVRWIERCAHDKDLHTRCPECDELTRQGQKMFEPLTPEDIIERDRDRHRDV